MGPSERQLGIVSYDIANGRGGKGIKLLLPQKIQPGKRYPVLYILPVSAAFWDQWWHNGIIEAAQQDIADQYGVICVYPQFERMPWYGDNPGNPKIRQESFILNDVIPFIDRNFPVSPGPEGRYLIGFSKSGFGAYHLLLRHPDIFGMAAAWDAPMIIDDLNVWGSGLRDVFGDKQNLRKYDIPALLSERAPELRSGRPRFVLMGYSYAKEQIEMIHALMASLNIPHVYDNSEKRDHRWDSGWFKNAVQSLFDYEHRENALTGLSFP
ncbi:MAG: alpha/beta hydrolase-fold protein [Candidatus Omnitrophota bacterium]|nr:alpha/beta hydrolase-fold protein [Candidatus Omnitrophota bacterium]MDZ4243072.1 alpha/beta hydrolase-fold protein [Candidatus Omnitrophota bacterium]